MIKLFDALLTDALPQIVSEQPWVRAYAIALRRIARSIIEATGTTKSVADVDGLDETVLDALAVELRSPVYDQTMPIETKRAIIKNGIYYFLRAGTAAAVQQLLTDIYSTAKTEDWFTYDGERGHFRIVVDVTDATGEDGPLALYSPEDVLRWLYAVKRGTAWLDSLSFMIRHCIVLGTGGKAGASVTAWMYTAPFCGIPLCGTYWTPSTEGHSCDCGVAVGGQAAGFCGCPPLCGTVPEKTTEGYSGEIHVQITGDVGAYLHDHPEAGADDALTGTMPEPSARGESAGGSVKVRGGTNTTLTAYLASSAACSMTAFCGQLPTIPQERG